METILLVEDNFEFASYLRTVLEAEGHYVVHESTVDQAVEVLQETDVDLVITDMVMEGADGTPNHASGLTIISFIALNENISPGIIAVTGIDWESSSIAALQPNHVEAKLRVLEKPIDSERLRTWVHELLVQRRREKRRRQEESKIQQELRRTQNTLETTPEAVLWISTEGRIFFANQSASRRTRYSRDELCNMSLTDLDLGIQSADEFASSVLPAIRREGGRTYETSLLRNDGTFFPVEIAAHLHQFEDQEFVSLFARDITDRKREEAELVAAKLAVEESERRFRGLADSATALFWVTERDSSCSWLNQKWLDYCGKTLEEQTGDQWVSTVHPSDRDPTGKIYLDAFERQVEFTLSYRLLRHDGVYRWHIANGSPRFSDDRQFLGFVGISFDDHERMESQLALQKSQSELESTVADLEAVNRELEHFAYVASHDLKQPLRGIFGYADWLKEDVGSLLSAESKEHLTQIGVLSKRMNSLLDDLLQYAKAGRTESMLEEFEMGQLVDSVSEILSPPTGMKVQYLGDRLTVTLPRIELEQVLRNLVGNAIKHHDRETGTVSVTAKSSQRGIAFEVADDGPGIPPQYHEQVFGIYKKLKSRDEVEGSGMGLSIVRKLVQARGGTIRIKSGEGRGTSFQFFWPFST